VGQFWLEQDETMDSEQFQNTVLHPLRKALSAAGWPKRETVYLHMDNAPAHRSLSTQAALDKLHFESVPHPPNSPDISPCDFFLFGRLKNLLQWQTFEDEDELKKGVNDALGFIGDEEFLRTFAAWPDRCQRIVRGKGKYLSS
jgi:hypothetical protein